ncbi:G-protein coupled receptor Mth2, partial [Exaiptasia diaphana]|uniref:G-protein coupled receptors family 2 profile 2 domain-containing protein n=1 Tax=Exaiptasia diaphana TaxID=2652724 RepID=A0A913X6M4_EXADI
ILLSQLLWLVGSKQLTDKPMVCTAIAVLLHYFFLVSFVWTSIIAFDTWKAFTTKGRRSMVDWKRKRLLHTLRYMAVGWLSVMVYVSICVALDQSQTVAIGYGSRAACWITNFNAKWIFFATPLGLVTVFNIVFFSMTVKAIRSSRRHARMVDKPANKRDFGIYVRIASVMGFTWVFGFAAPFGWMILWYVYVILSSLQGVYIAIAFALNKRARNLYIKLLCKTKVSASRNAYSVGGKDGPKDRTKDRPMASLQKFKTLNVSNL